MADPQDERPIALEAYEALAESYAALVDTTPENADCERPATLPLLPDEAGKRVLDAGCGPGSYDLVLSPLVLDYIREWESVFAEFHRVLREAGLLVFSVGHPFAGFKLRDSEDYFATELVETPWRGFGVGVVMPSYRRPLGAMVSALTEVGFAVEELVEARPTEGFKRKDPQGYEQFSRCPSFLGMRARNEGR